MDLNWLWLIIPLSYYAISLFFLCFPNIFHKRMKYKSQILNELVNSDKLFCIGHRGGGFEGPENTLQLFRKNDANTHMFQLDVCQTKDKQLVVHHDSTLSRTCKKELQIKNLNYSELPTFAPEFQSFGGGPMKSESNKIPLLDDLFSEFPEKIMNIELKTPTETSIKEFDRLVRKHKRQDITVWGVAGGLNQNLRSTNPQVVNFYSAGETLKIFLLCIFGLLPFVCLRQGVLDIPLMTNRFAEIIYGFVGSGCKKCLACFGILVLKFFNLISRLFIPHLKKRGILTFYFILNDTQDFDTSISMGCSGIMTDRTEMLRDYLKAKNLYFGSDSDSF